MTLVEKGFLVNNMNLSISSDAMRSMITWCRVISSDEEMLSTNRHKHVIHELQYVYKGELQFDFDGNVLKCCEGEYIFIPAGNIHSIKDNAPYTQKLVLGFDIISDNDTINNTFNNAQKPIAKVGSKTFRELAKALKYKILSRDLMTSVSMACIVHTLLLETVDSLTENFVSKAQLRESEDSQRIDRILSFINENAFNNITVTDVANALHLSVRQTSRICRSLFSCTVNQLIVQVRLKQICQLLTNSKYSIAEIAEIANFANPYSLSRYFSHYAGVTPSAYRKNYEIHNYAENVFKPKTKG